MTSLVNVGQENLLTFVLIEHNCLGYASGPWSGSGKVSNVLPRKT